MAIKESIELNVSAFLNSLNQAKSEIEKTGAALEQAFQKNVKVDIDQSGLKKAEQTAKSTAKSIETSIEQAGKSAGKGFGDGFAKNAATELNDVGKDFSKNFTADLQKAEASAKGVFGNIAKSFKEGQAEANSGGGLFGTLANSVGQLATPIGAATAALGALTAGVVSAFEKGTAYNSALGDLRAKTGLVGEEFEALKLAAEDAFIGGVGESVADAATIIGNVQLQLGNVFNPEELSSFTVRAQALGNLFDKDVNEIIQKATPFIKQFGLESEEAFNLLAKSLKEGGTASDDVLDSLAEYSQLAQEAGFSAQEFAETLTRGAQEGVFNTDKIADSIKEAQIRLKAGDFEKAFKDIIDGSQGVEQSIAQQALKFQELGKSGAISVKEALAGSSKVISDALQSGQINEAFASQLQVAVAGTPAEDLGVELYNKIFGAPIDEKLVSEKAAQVGASIQGATGQYTFFENVQRQFDLFLTTAGQGLVNFTDKILQPVLSGWWEYLYNAFVEPLANVWTTIEEAFAPIGKLIEDIFGGASEQATGFKDIMGAIGDVVGFVVNAALIPLRFVITNVAKVIEGALIGFKTLRDYFINLYNSGGLFKNVIDALVSAFEELGGFVSWVVDGISDFFSSLGGGTSKAMTKAKKDTQDLGKEVQAQNKAAQNSADTLKKSEDDLAKAKDNRKRSDDAAKKRAEELQKQQEALEKYLTGSSDRIRKQQLQEEKLLTDGYIAELKARREAIEEDEELTAKAKLEQILGVDLEVIRTERDAKIKALQETYKAEIEAAERNAEELIKSQKLNAEQQKQVYEALNSEKLQLERVFNVNREAIEIDSDRRVSEARLNNYKETQKLLAEAALETAALITAQQKEALSQQQSALLDYNNLISGLRQQTDDLASQLAARFNNSGRNFVEDETLQRETDELRQQLAARELTYAAFVDKVRGNQRELNRDIEDGWLESTGVITGITAAMAQEIQRALDTSQERFQLATKTFVLDAEGNRTMIEKQYSDVMTLLEDTSIAALDVLSNTFALAVVEGQDAGKQVALAFLDMLQSLVPAFTAMIFGVTQASPENILSLGAWGVLKFAAVMGTLTALVQSAKSAIGGAWTGYVPGGKEPEKQKNPLDTKLIWFNPQESIIPADITSREKPLLEWLVKNKSKSSMDYFREFVLPKMDTPNLSFSPAGVLIHNDTIRQDKLLEEIARNTSRKHNDRVAIEHEFKPLKVRGGDLVANYKKSLAKEMARV